MLRQARERTIDTDCRGFGSGWLVTWVSVLCILGFATPSGQAEAQRVGEVFRDCEVCPEMVVVPAGSFMMGSPESDEEAFDNEKPQHRVTIDYAFAVGAYEVTFEEWDACVRGGGCGGYEPPDRGWGRGRRPVMAVSWEHAWQYADWLTEQTGEEYRLLTEAEWEYAARAGTSTPRYWGEGELGRVQCRYANGNDETLGCRDRHEGSATVGTYLPNAFGLYDVLGNVREWVDDCWNENYEGAPTDGRSWYEGDCSRRVLRSGSWTHGPWILRSAFRVRSSTGSRDGDFGFRVARTMN